LPDSDTVGEESNFFEPDRVSGIERKIGGIGILGFDSDDLDSRSELF
jgi:hypothetical protein